MTLREKLMHYFCSYGEPKMDGGADDAADGNV